jgi:ketosteroid isomerase-like protein
MGDIYAKLAAQAYNKALQLDATNSAALNPKLALIRELFAPGRTPGVPTRTATAPAAAAATRAPAAPAAASAPPAAPPAVAAAPVVAAAPAAAPKPPVAAPVTPVAEAAPAAAPVRTPAAEPVSAPAARSDSASGADTAAQQDVESAVKAWAAAWSARDMKNYLSSYGKQFDPPGSQSRSAWEKEREARIVGKKQIKVTITDLSVDVKGDKATARFHQAYSADTLSVASRKTLELARSQGRWVIVRESTGS